MSRVRRTGSIDDLRLHVEATPLALVEWDPHYRVKGFSRRAEELFGWTAAEVVGRRIDEIPWVPPEDWPKVRAVMEDMRSGVRSTNVNANRNLRKDGRVIRCEWYNSALHDGAGALASVLSLVLDVTAREEALEALAESRERLDLLVAHAPAAIALLDRDMRYLAASRRWMTDYGLGDREILGRSHYEIFPEIPERWREIHRRCLAGAVERSDEDPFPRSDGGTDWVRWEIRPWRGADGAVAGIVILSEVITEQRRLREQLAVAARLASLGTLASGLAHEINNPLAGELSGQGLAIEGVREVRDRLRGGAPLEPTALAARLDDVLEVLADAQGGGLRIARIVRNLNVMGRPDLRRQRVRLRAVVDEALRRVGSEVGRRAEVTVDEAPSPEVQASPGHLEQVLEALLDNAARAIPAGRRGAIAVRLGAGPEGTARVEVEDDGTGIPGEVLPRIFDPFFTTRDVGQGVGLGLAVAHAVVTAHGGTLTAESRPGWGTLFRIELPAARC